MAQATGKKTPLKNIISSERNLALMGDAGWKFVEDLEGVSQDALAATGIGQLTMEKVLVALGGKIKKSEEKKVEIEECDDPIVVQSPYSSYCLQVLPGDGIRTNAGGVIPIQPIYLVCTAGRGELTQRMWLMRKYKREEDKVLDHIEKKMPWRKEAHTWLSTRKGHKKKRFMILSD